MSTVQFRAVRYRTLTCQTDNDSPQYTVHFILSSDGSASLPPLTRARHDNRTMMGLQPLPDRSNEHDRSMKASPGRHLLTTWVVVAWGFFILTTIIIHELAVRSTWSTSRIVAGAAIPWAFRPETGLPSVLRTAFAQAHGPITAMHLARLAVNALSVRWASPKTWMEVYWLADRRWADPFGLSTTGWTIATRRLRVSFSLCLFAVLNIVALVTPVFMARAYAVVTSDVEHEVTIDTVSALDLPKLRAVTNISQIKTGNELWAKGVSSSELFARNAYTESGMRPSETGGAWFFTGDSHRTEMLLYGIRVTGGCDILNTQVKNLDEFHDLCTEDLEYRLSSGTKCEPTTTRLWSSLTASKQYRSAICSQGHIQNGVLGSEIFQRAPTLEREQSSDTAHPWRHL